MRIDGGIIFKIKKYAIHDGVVWCTFLHQLSWLTDDPPQDAALFWSEGYPAMQDVSQNLAAARRAGYEPLAPGFVHIDAPDSYRDVPHWFDLYDATFTDSHEHATAWWSITDVVTQSSNVGTIEMSST